MSVYSALRSTITPSLTADNWTLSALTNGTTTTNSCRVVAVHWGGEVTTSTAMQTEVKRPTTASVGAITAITKGTAHPNSVPICVVASTWATTQAVIPAVGVGVLIGESWNAHGGIFYWHAGNADEELVLLGNILTGQISCRNFTGTGTSSYGLTYRED